MAGKTVREYLNLTFQGADGLNTFLHLFRIKTSGPGFSVPLINREISEIYAGTRWPRPFEQWRRLPGVEPKNPNGGANSRDMTWIPSTYLSS